MKKIFFEKKIIQEDIFLLKKKIAHENNIFKSLMKKNKIDKKKKIKFFFGKKGN